MNILDIAGAALHWNLPPADSPKFGWSSVDSAKLAREAWLLLLPWLATKALEVIPPLIGSHGYRFEIAGKDETLYVVLALRLALQWAKSYLQGQHLPVPADPPQS